MADNNTLPEHAEILLKQAKLCTSDKLPKTYSEQNHLLWQAFELGREYERKGGK